MTGPDGKPGKAQAGSLTASIRDATQEQSGSSEAAETL